MFGISWRKSIPESTLITRESKLTLNRKYQVLVDTPAKRKVIPNVVILKDHDEITGMFLMRRADAEANAVVPEAFIDESSGDKLDVWVPVSWCSLTLLEDSE